LQGNCKICSGETTVLRDEKFEIDYYSCNHCYYIFSDDKDIVSPEKEISLYRQHNNTMENEGYVNMFKEFIKITVDPYAERIKTALDFGCGPGPVLAALLKKRGFEVDIYDPYFAPDKVYEEKSYDLITSTEVFEHLQDPLGTAALLKKHLRNNGILAIMTLFHPGDKDLFLKWWYRHDPTHISFYRPETFEVLANKLNLEVLTVDGKNICVLAEQRTG